MKKHLHLVKAAILLVCLAALGCSSNEFGGSFDIDKICFSDNGTKDCSESNPQVSISSRKELEVFLTLTNRMAPVEGTGPTARVYRVGFEYLAPGGKTIPTRFEQLAVNVGPGSTVDQTVTAFSLDQINYIAGLPGEFSDFPFQVNCKVTVWYETTTSVKGYVERLYSFLVTS